ncbi:neurofilament heavy polypeptide-like isoform X1 [Pimephales promelas]|uniref:neurofilament heavy polypeptide-like isoform X1 n=1 Tax=Pimephales promelas TaxID=90988 RepID=UPI0019555257|nr:neurofilament heavy polypeptide-like isoform X1 [Pimephales promelas]
MSKSTISEVADQSSSTELDELTAAFAAGRWWAIMEVSDPIPDNFEYDYSFSGQLGGKVEAGETPCPSSLVFNDESEKAHSQHSGFSDATLKTTREWRQKTTLKWRQRSKQGAPFYARSTQETPEPARSTRCMPVRSQQKSFSDATMAMDQRRKWRQKKPKTASSKEAPEPIEFLQRGQLMPEYMPPPTSIHSPKRAPVAASHGVPMQDNISKRQKLTFPEPEIVPVCRAQGALVPDRIPVKRHFKTPEMQRQHLQNALVRVSSANRRIPMEQREKLREQWRQRRKQNCPKGAKTPQKRPASPRYPERAPTSRWSKRVCLRNTEAFDNGPPQKLCVELRRYNHQDPQKSPSPPNRRNRDRLQHRSQPTRKRDMDTAGLHRAPPKNRCVELRRYNHQDPQKSPSPPNRRNRDRLQPRSQPTRKRDMDTAGLHRAPPKKRCVELRRYNHQDPQKSPSPPNRRNQDRLQPRSQPTRKRDMDDSAGEEMSQPQKKPRMAIKFNNQRSGPGIFDQIEHLCCLFAKFCVI